MEVGSQSVSSLGSGTEKCTQGAQSDRIVWSLSTSVHTCPLLPFTSSKSIQPTFSPGTYLRINPIPRCVVGECALLIPLSQLSQKAGSLSDAEGKRGVWQSSPPPNLPRERRGRRWRITRPDPKLQESTGAINCRGSVGSQCPLCIWGISCWWPATGPRTPGGRGACRVIS